MFINIPCLNADLKASKSCYGGSGESENKRNPSIVILIIDGMKIFFAYKPSM